MGTTPKMPYIGFNGGETTPRHTNLKQMTIIRDIATGKVRLSLVEDNAFLSAIQGLHSFVVDNNADCDMAYDWVCDQADISSFVADNYAWDMFFDVYSQAAELDA
jgi:hypothetical protein